MPTNRVLLLSLFVVMMIIGGCAPDEQQEDAGQSVVVRLPSDPDRLQPELSSSGYSQQLENHMFASLTEYNPYTLKPELVLAAEEPVVEDWVENGDTVGLIIHYEIRREANWSTGNPITGEDYLFTQKVFFNPKVNAAKIRGYLDFIRKIEVDPDNPKKFSVFAEGKYFLAEPVSSMIPIYPKHHYDPNSWLDTFSLQTLKERSDQLSKAAEEVLDSFANRFSSPEYSRKNPMGAGAYRLKEWTPNQRLVLERKEDWWGDKYSGENVFFSANPKEIQYVIMPDEVGAISALKAGQVDVITEISPQQFQKLKREASERLQFMSPSLFQYYYIGLNNRDPRLQDRRVRRALMHLLNVEKIRTVVLDSLARRIVGPFHPSKSYYNDTLDLIPYDPAKARTLLDRAGWKDSNGDGIRDKIIDGQRLDLQLELNSTGSQIGEQIALIFRQGAGKGGVEVEVENQEFRITLQDMRERTYQMSLLVNRQYALPADPYQNWHTDNDRPDGSNYYGFGDEESDQIIKTLRKTLDPEKRRDLYYRFQEIIYHRQPVLFMVSPEETIVISDRWKVRKAARHPGFFVPQFEAK